MVWSRLRMRRFESGDLPFLRELLLNPNVMQFTGFGRPQTENEIGDCLNRWMAPSQECWGVWAVEAQARGRVGWVMLQGGPPEPEMGLMLLQSRWREGYGTEMCRWAIAHAFAQPGVARVLARVHPANLHSVGLLEKVGMRCVGQTKDTLRYEILGTE